MSLVLLDWQERSLPPPIVIELFSRQFGEMEMSVSNQIVELLKNYCWQKQERHLEGGVLGDLESGQDFRRRDAKPMTPSPRAINA